MKRTTTAGTSQGPSRPPSSARSAQPSTPISDNRQRCLPSLLHWPRLWPEPWKSLWEERSAIKEYDGKMERAVAEREAAQELRQAFDNAIKAKG